MLTAMAERAAILIREPRAGERSWIERQLRDSWGSTVIVSHGTKFDASELAALVAIQGDELVGLATLTRLGGSSRQSP